MSAPPAANRNASPVQQQPAAMNLPQAPGAHIFSEEQYNLEKNYNLLAQKIAANCGVQIKGNIDLDIVARSATDFLAKKAATENSNKIFAKLEEHWKPILAETDPSPLRLAMGGSMFSACGSDIIKVQTKELNEDVKQKFYKTLNDLGVKFDVAGQSPNEIIKVKREDLMKAAMIYRVRNPVCTPQDEALYNRILAGTMSEDNAINNRAATVGTLTSVLSIASTACSTLMAFGVIGGVGPIAIGVMAVTVLLMIPRIIGTFRSVSKLGDNDMAEKIQDSFEKFNGALKNDGSEMANISKMMMHHYINKECNSVELAQRYLDEAKVTQQYRIRKTGILAPAKLTAPQQQAMNKAYKNNYPVKQVKQNASQYNLNNSRGQCICR